VNGSWLPPSYLNDTLIFPVALHLAILDRHVEGRDLGDAQVAEALRRQGEESG
jgi:hypothetical protein